MAVKTGTVVAALLALIAGAAAAQGVERRISAQDGVDLYGGDLRALMRSDYDSCVEACLTDRACAAFTYNVRAGACFLKDGSSLAKPFDGAISGRVIVAEPPSPLRAQALGFLPAQYLAGARRMAARIGADERSGTGAAAAERDAASDWAAVAREALAAAGVADALADPPADQPTYALLERAVMAAARAFLRAPDAAAEAEALALIAAAIGPLGEGQAALTALRRAEAAQPTPDRATAREAAQARWGFRVTGHRAESDLAAPRICVEFSEPLASLGVEYGDYLRVEGVDAAVTAAGAQICAEGLEHGRPYRLTVRQGLPAADGQALGRPVAIDVHVRDRSPAARFAGRAHVLPRGGAAEIALTTVNVDRVDLRLHRVGPRNLLAAMQSGLFGRALDGWSEDRLAGEVGAEIWRGQADVANALNRDMVTALPLADVLAGVAPGLHALTARPAGQDAPWDDAATQWFVVTDIGLATATAGDGLHAFVRSLGSAEPLAGARLTLLSASNEPLGVAATDAEGYARFAPGLLRGRGGMAPALLAAETEAGDFAFLDLSAPGFDLSDRGVEGRAAPGPLDVFLTAERGVWRPGETVHAVALARDARADAAPGLALTMVLSRPDGVEHSRALLPDQGAGGRAWSFALPQGAQRGAWRLAAHADPAAPALAAIAILVEDFVPERLALELSLPEGPVAAGAAVEAQLAARWLFGAPAAGLATEIEARLAPADALPGWDGWRFGLTDDPARPVLTTLAGPTADAAGEALLLVAPPAAPQTTRPLALTVLGRVLDPSGRAVERAQTRPLAPAAPLIGLRPRFSGDLDEGAEAAFDVVAVGPDLRGAALARVDWSLSRIETRFQWYAVGADWRWESVETRERVAGGTVALNAEPVRIAAPTRWGRYELRATRADGGPFTAASLRFTAGWRGQGGAPDAPDMLAVGLDQPSYRVGDVARLRLTAPAAGKALALVLGDGLLARRLIDVAAGETVIDLPVTQDWGAGVYAVASFLRPLEAPAAGRAPARALGLAWAGVDPGARVLDAHFEGAETATPRAPLDVALRVAGLAPGARAFATISAVDVGVLNLTGFAAPAPENWAFGQRRLGATLRDLYGALIEPGGGAPGRLRSGGDGGAPRIDGAPPEGETVAFATATLDVGADGLARARFDLPDFNGALRLSAMVWTENGLGHAVKDVLVRDAVVATLAGPRFLAPGDVSRVALDLTNVSGPAGEAVVTLSAEGGLSVDPTPLRVALTAGGRATAALSVTADAPGPAALIARVATPDGAVADKRLAVAVRANDPLIERRARRLLRPGERLEVGADAFAGFGPDAQATLTAGPLAELDVAALAAGLDRHPFGCTEQLISRATPLLALPRVSTALGLAAEAELPARIDDAVAGVLANQSAEGGFGLWRPGGGELWLDAHATDFLTRARDAGRPVPARAVAAALANLRTQVGYGGDLEQGGAGLAHALHVLAREGSGSLGDLRYHADAQAGRFTTPLGRAHLGAALALYGEQARADAAFAAAQAMLDQPQDISQWRSDFGSDLRDAAGVLMLATEARSRAVDARALAARVAAALDAGDASTQEMAWALRAAAALAGDGAAAVRRIGAGETATLVNDGPAPMAVALSVAGSPDGPVAAEAAGYAIERAWFDLQGRPVSPDTVAQGARLVAVLTIAEDQPREGRLIVVDPLPAGFEIDNPALVRAGELSALGWLDPVAEPAHAAFQDDRFVAALDWRANGTAQLAYVVRAVSPGRFHHPAASVQDMYRPALRGRTASGAAQVTAP